MKSNLVCTVLRTTISFSTNMMFEIAIKVVSIICIKQTLKGCIVNLK